MNWKKTLIRNVLFAVLLAAAGGFCVGCFTATTLDQLGSTRSFIAGEHYEFSPSRDEIVFSCRKEKEYNYIKMEKAKETQLSIPEAFENIKKKYFKK